MGWSSSLRCNWCAFQANSERGKVRGSRLCGIAGTFAWVSEHAAFDPRVAIQMCDQMAHRGPDGHGSWSAPAHRVALAHRRLAIIDLTDAGAQPMHDEQRGLSIVFNGEIYNYRELRSGLEARGYRFRTQSDTEVLLAAYAIYGTGMMPLLRGMFAFAIWDSKAGQLLLARDPLGIKPLYYSARNGVFMFASQVRALQAAGAGVSPSAAGHVGFFSLRACTGAVHALRGHQEPAVGHDDARHTERAAGPSSVLESY